MKTTFQHFDLELVKPDFNSGLMDAFLELTHLRRRQLGGTTTPTVFFQLKSIFHLLESVGSARIEGNRTTVSEYVEQKIHTNQSRSESFHEIANVEKAMSFIEDNIDIGSEITHQFIRELHLITVQSLTVEGDKTPGAYRESDVMIAGSNHRPPGHIQVKIYMDELLKFINKQDDKKYDLIKTATAHHRFAWIHPFGNGNGRVVRLLTYALLIKFGFRVRNGQIINPTAVFCNDRELYYSMLSSADSGKTEDILAWCEYVLTGICKEITKIDKLLDYEYLKSNILIPSINLAYERKSITEQEKKILSLGANKQVFKAGLINEVFDNIEDRQRTHIIAKLKKEKLITATKKHGRTYIVSFYNNYLMRYLIQILEREKFIPPINE